MRKLIVAEFMSLDGVMEGPGPEDGFERAGWTMPYWSDEVGNVIGSYMSRSDAMLLGRKTYQGFAAAFSGQTNDDANFMNNVPKYVVSTTLKKADWKNSTLINGNIVAAITRLTQQPGKDIVINGSCTLVQSLIKHDLVDEYSLLVYPVVVGSGKRLFGDGSMVKLKLVDSRGLGSGVVHLVYQPDRKA